MSESYQDYPKWVYNAQGESKIVGSSEEQQELVGDWRDHPDAFTSQTPVVFGWANTGMPAAYVPVAYPRWKYAYGQEPVIVQTVVEESALGAGWVDSPADAVAPPVTPDDAATSAAASKAKGA